MTRRRPCRAACVFSLFSLISLLAVAAAGAEIADLKPQAAEALRRATEYFSRHVATEGGCLWRYSEDLTQREGEGKASDRTVWVQPPGTPSVGMALLDAYEATGDPLYLDAARHAGECLIRGQLRSGGWDYRIDFDPAVRKRYAFRVDRPASTAKVRNTSTLDDNTTQAALGLLIRLDHVLNLSGSKIPGRKGQGGAPGPHRREGKDGSGIDAKIHEAASYGLGALLAVQYPNGAWPQRFSSPPDPARFPVKKAEYPESWSRTFPGDKYADYYTFNDHALGDTVDVMLEAARIYEDPRFARAAQRAGDFILLAQMPEPQPAWAQQYDAQMHPAWARKFEPPSVTGGESQGVFRILFTLYRATGEKKYLEPVPRALAYLRRSQLPDGRLARFYELKTNKPLYFTRQYELTYSDSDLPTHYAFKVSHALDNLEREYRRLLELKGDALARSNRASRAAPSAEQVRVVIAALDAQGRWLIRDRLRYQDSESPVQRIFDSQTFINNVRLLSRYLAANRAASGPVEGKDSSGATERGGAVSGTFSIVAADPETGICGAAVASKYPAVGKVVPYVRGGVGAFCTQHWHQPTWGPRALDLLQQGSAPEEVLAELLRGDTHREKRQLAIVDLQGRAVNRNPADADPSGIYWGAMTGRYYACQGNTLAGRAVITAMAEAYEQTRGSLANRLVAALVAGDRAGGDHRGRLAAGLRVAKRGADDWLNLQVDKSDDAVRELARKYAEIDHEAKR